MRAFEIAKIHVDFTMCVWQWSLNNVTFTKCVDRSFSKSMVFTMDKLCFVNPDDEWIQLIGSELNSFDKFVWEYIKKGQF